MRLQTSPGRPRPLTSLGPPHRTPAPPPPPFRLKKKKKNSAGERSAGTISEPPSPSLDTASLEFSSEEAYHAHLEGQGKLPQGFRVGTDGLRFVPREVPTEVSMNVTAIVMDEVCAALSLAFLLLHEGSALGVDVSGRGGWCAEMVPLGLVGIGSLAVAARLGVLMPRFASCCFGVRCGAVAVLLP